MAKQGFGSIAPPKAGGNDNVRLEELVDVMKFKPDEWVTMRFIPGPILAYKIHWIRIYGGKEKKLIKIPRICLAFDSDNESVPKKGVKCPYCTLSHGGDESGASANSQVVYLTNAINREAQEDEPAKKVRPDKSELKTGFKDINSKSWTPIETVKLPSSLASKLQELAERNIYTDKTGKKKAYDISDAKYGIDISIKYKPKASGTDKYSVDKGPRTKLTEEELELLKWDINEDLLTKMGLMSEQQAMIDFKRMEIVGEESSAKDLDDEDGIDLGRKTKKRGLDDDDEDDVPRKKNKKRDLDDDDEDDEDDAPRKKRKAVDDDEDDDEDEDDDAPRSKKKAKASKSRDLDDEDDDEVPKKKKKKVIDDDDDDEPKAKKKGKSKRDDDEDDDEDDEPPRKKRKAVDDDDEPKAKKKGKSKRDEDEDDEDEPPKKKKKKLDFDDDIPF